MEEARVLSAESLVFGSDETPRVVCIDADPTASERVTVYAREGEAAKSAAHTFRPFLWARDEELLAGAPAAARCRSPWANSPSVVPRRPSPGPSSP